MTSLHSIDLSFNKLTAIPDNLSSLHNLKHLYLHCNRITAIPAQISQLQKLWTLDLDGNSITSIPEELASLRKLQELKLDYNAITSIPLRISSLSSLRHLSLSHNKLERIPHEVCSLASLEMLFLNDNCITEISKDFSSFGNLALQVYNNPLQVPVELWHLTRLTANFRVFFTPTYSDDVIYAVGSIEELGSWDAEHAPRLRSFPVHGEAKEEWQTSVEIPAHKFPFKYRFVMYNKTTRQVRWESKGRLMQICHVSAPSSSTFDLFDDDTAIK